MSDHKNYNNNPKSNGFFSFLSTFLQYIGIRRYSNSQNEEQNENNDEGEPEDDDHEDCNDENNEVEENDEVDENEDEEDEEEEDEEDEGDEEDEIFPMIELLHQTVQIGLHNNDQYENETQDQNSFG